MYCPKCSQPQASDEMQFCSHCGLPLINLKEMVRGESAMNATPPSAETLSPRQKGLRQGLVLIALSVILIPAYVLLAPLFPPHDRLVESSVSDTPFDKISQIVLLTIFMLGLTRVLYARLFQSAAESNNEHKIAELKSSRASHQLPPAQGIPVSGFGSWRVNTGEMAEPKAATGRPTKSLEGE